ncbi:MAG: GNAT family N-acetyltransferase [Deltaproteobacteria bacterium]|nr:GNAT family N-acetyltransferase [Deltaproteobacteria bacterium]
MSGGKLTLLRAEGADAARWTAALEGMPGADIYFTPAYTRLFSELEGDEAIAALWESTRGRALFPLQIRSLARLPFCSPGRLGGRGSTPAYDAASPYGYSGPLVDAPGGEAPDLIREFTGALWEELRGRRIVSLFIRFHPLAKNTEYFQVDGIDPALRSETVYMDLTGAWYKGLTSKCRYEVRKSDRRGAIVEVSEDPDDWRVFGELYRATMIHRSARKWYVFPQSFFEETRRLLGRGVFLLVARHAGSLVAGSLFLQGFGKLHYHLSGATPEAAGLGVSNRLIVEAARIGEARGATTLHLGGGLVPGDGLYKYKASFSPLRAVWDKACVVLDREAYADLEEGRRKFLTARADEAVEENPRYFPAYRQGLQRFMEGRNG